MEWKECWIAHPGVTWNIARLRLQMGMQVRVVGHAD